MQLKTVKSAADLPFKGVELVKTDNAISEVIIGGKLRIRAGAYTGIQVLVETPFEAGERWRVEAKTEGFDPKVLYFDSSYEASTAATEYERKGADVTTAKVSALIDENGTVVGVEGETATTRELEDIPF